MSAIRRAWAWITVITGAVISLLCGVLLYGRRRMKEGEALGQIDEERERLHEAAARGDDAAVEEEWRRSRQ